MSLLGVHLATMIGPTVPVPLPGDIAGAIEQVVVQVEDEQPAGCQITFRTGKSQGTGAVSDLVLRTLLRLGARVVLTVTVGAIPSVLFDGYITRKEANPGQRPGESTLTISCVDQTFKMGLEEKSAEYPAQPDALIATQIIATYGLIPLVIPPVSFDVPLPTERVPVQQGTDLSFLRSLASQYGYVFYVVPGPLPLMNTGYWGPPIRVGVLQSALNVDMGPFTNVERLEASSSNDTPTLVQGQVLDRQTGQKLPVFTIGSSRIPLGREPVVTYDLTAMRTQILRDPGVNSIQAFARAQAITDASTDSPLTATGSLNTARYGSVLQPRALVGVRGIGDDFDGNWYVKRVTHTLKKGSYLQDFSLTRGEIGALLPLVLP